MSAGCDRVLACQSEGRGPPNPVGIARPATTAPRLPAPRTERLPSLAGDLRREGLVIGASRDHMQHESLPRPVTTAPAAVKPVYRRGRYASSQPRLVSVLVSFTPARHRSPVAA